MEEPYLIYTSRESSILAYGEQKRTPFTIALLITAIVVGLGLFCWLIWSCLRPAFHIPTHTPLLLTSSPKILQRTIPQTMRDRLPKLWQEIVRTNSSFSAIFGAYPTEKGWKSFAIVPRWIGTQKEFLRQDVLLVSFVTDDQDIQGDRLLRYTDRSDWKKTKRGAEIGFWIDTSSWIDSQNASTRFTATLDQRVIRTDIPVTQLPPEQLPTGDVVLRIPKDAALLPLVRAFLDQVQIGDITLNTLHPAPETVALRLTPSSTIASIRLAFEAPVTHEQLNTVFFGLRKTTRAPASMPNGEIMYEKRPWLQTTDPIPTSTQSLFGRVDVETNILNFYATETTPLPFQEPPLACKQGQPLAFFSSEVMKQLPLSLITPTETPAPLYFVAFDGKMIACF
ncbi:MAG: hypothetical protein WCV84_04175 [Patescibacteria group bacterium]